MTDEEIMEGFFDLYNIENQNKNNEYTHLLKEKIESNINQIDSLIKYINGI